MKLVEKKCPNCGASLSFDSDDKEVTCKYCNNSFEIERDLKDLIDTDRIAKIANDMLDPETFSLHKKAMKRFGSIFIIVWALIFIVSLVIFISVASHVFPRIFG